MPRPNRRKRSRVTSEDVDWRRESLYGELNSPEEVDLEALAKEEEEKTKKKGFYFWVYSFAQKHFVDKKKEKYHTPEAVEFEETDTSRKTRKTKKKKEEKVLPKEYVEAFDFLGWKLDKDVVLKMPFAAGVIGLILGVFLSALLYIPLSYVPDPAYECGDGVCGYNPITDVQETADTCPADCLSTGGFLKSDYPTTGASPIVLLIVLFIPIFLTLGLVMYVQRYPISAANTEKMRAMTYVPEIMNYMIMQMRLQPNLERSVDFAAEHGEGRIAEEFKEVLWKNRVGIYENIEEGLDEMAYRWEPYSEEFKHAITMLRASVLVPSDIERGILYDNILKDILDSTREKMELYTHSMKQPAMYLFYIAVLLPLMIIIMLPVAAAFAGLPVATTPVLGGLYLFFLPFITYIYANTVLAKRPGGYVPPEIPDNHPDLPKKGTAKIGNLNLPIVPIAVMIAIAILFVGFTINSAMQLTEAELVKYEAVYGKNASQPTILQYIIPLAIALPLGFYFFASNINKRNIQQKIFKMELDFKDAMYLLASRLGEKKPLEDALKYVTKFMPESKVATELLATIERNIMVLGLTLKSAIFDPNYGAMKFIPSRLIASSFRIMTDSIELGPEVASTSLISVSNQIRNVQKINDLMKKLLNDVTGMMNSMAKFISPVVLGLVASLQQVIIAVIEPLASSGSGDGSSSMGGLSVNAMDGMASPFEFQLIVALYVIELVILLSYFSGKIEFGDNKTAILLNVGKTLPIAIIVFVASLYMGGGLVGGIAG